MKSLMSITCIRKGYVFLCISIMIDCFKAFLVLYLGSSHSYNTRNAPRFGLVGDLLPAAQDPYPCSRVTFPKIGTHIEGFFRKKGTYFLRSVFLRWTIYSGFLPMFYFIHPLFVCCFFLCFLMENILILILNWFTDSFIYWESVDSLTTFNPQSGKKTTKGLTVFHRLSQYSQ